MIKTLPSPHRHQVQCIHVNTCELFNFKNNDYSYHPYFRRDGLFGHELLANVPVLARSKEMRVPYL